MTERRGVKRIGETISSEGGKGKGMALARNSLPSKPTE
jgi:hypothetical protein